MYKNVELSICYNVAILKFKFLLKSTGKSFRINSVSGFFDQIIEYFPILVCFFSSIIIASGSILFIYSIHPGNLSSCKSRFRKFSLFRVPQSARYDRKSVMMATLTCYIITTESLHSLNWDSTVIIIILVLFTFYVP